MKNAKFDLVTIIFLWIVRGSDHDTSCTGVVLNCKRNKGRRDNVCSIDCKKTGVYRFENMGKKVP